MQWRFCEAPNKVMFGINLSRRSRGLVTAWRSNRQNCSTSSTHLSQRTRDGPGWQSETQPIL